MTFNVDLATGLEYEKQCLAKIQRKYPCAVMVDAHKGYDIWIPETGKSVEVKADLESAKTRRWLIEVEMGGKPSGLSTSTADVWVFTDGQKWLTVATKALIVHILRTGYLQHKVTGAGDSKSKLCYFIPERDLEAICAPMN